MSFNRTQILISRIEKKLPKYGIQDFDSDEILDYLNMVQDYLCRKKFAFKGKVDFQLEPGKESYSVSGRIHKIAGFILPVNWPDLHVYASLNEWIEFKKATNSSTSYPVGMFVWGEQAYFHPIPNTYIKIEMFYYGLPMSEITLENLPAIGEEWDLALIYGVLAEYNPDARPLYEKYADEQMMLQLNETVKGVIKLDHSSNKLGF